MHGATTRELNYLPDYQPEISGRNKNERRPPKSLLCTLTFLPISTCRFNTTCIIDNYDTNTDNQYQADKMTKGSIKFPLTLMAGFHAK